MLGDVKKFAKDMVRAIDVSLDRVNRLGAPQRLILTSQLVGSIDTLSAMLVFFGRVAPKAARFVAGGRRQLAQLRTDARRMRSEAFAELFAEPEPPDEPSTDEQAPAPQPVASVIDVQPSNDGA